MGWPCAAAAARGGAGRGGGWKLISPVVRGDPRRLKLRGGRWPGPATLHPALAGLAAVGRGARRQGWAGQ